MVFLQVERLLGNHQWGLLRGFLFLSTIYLDGMHYILALAYDTYVFHLHPLHLSFQQELHLFHEGYDR